MEKDSKGEQVPKKGSTHSDKKATKGSHHRDKQPSTTLKASTGTKKDASAGSHHTATTASLPSLSQPEGEPRGATRPSSSKRATRLHSSTESHRVDPSKHGPLLHPKPEPEKTTASQTSKMRSIESAASVTRKDVGQVRQKTTEAEEPSPSKTAFQVTKKPKDKKPPGVGFLPPSAKEPSRTPPDIDEANKAPSDYSRIHSTAISRDERSEATELRTDLSARHKFLAKEIRRLTQATIRIPDHLLQTEEDKSAIASQPVLIYAKPPVSQHNPVAKDAKGAPTQHCKDTSTKRGHQSPRRMSVLLILIFVTFLVLASVLLVMAAYGYLFAEKLLVKCHTPECLKLADSITKLLNPSINPCDDFYGHVCGKWIKQPGSGFMKDILDAFQRTIIQSIDSKTSTKPSVYGLHVLTKLYDSCSSYMTQGSGSFGEDLRTISGLLNLPKMLNAGNSEQILAYLLGTALTTGIHSVFTVEFHRLGIRTVLRVAPGASIGAKLKAAVTDDPLDDGMRHEVSIVKGLVEKMLKEFHAVNYSDGLVRDVVDIDMDISESLMLPATVSEMRFSDLQSLLSLSSPVFALDLINSNVPANLKIKMDDSIWMVGYDIIKNIQGALLKRVFETAKCYYVSNLLTGLMQYPYLRTLKQKRQDLFSFVCLRATRVALTNTWPYLIAELSGYHGSMAASSVAAAVRGALLHEDILAIFSSFVQEEARNAIEDLTFVTYDESELSELGPDVDYTSWKLEGSFLPLLIQASSLETKILFRALYGKGISTLSKNQLTSNLTYSASERMLTIPTAYQGPPLLFRDTKTIPYYFNYATLGALVAKEMIRSVLKPFKHSKKAQQQLEASLHCLKKVGEAQGLNLSDAFGEEKWNSDVVLWSYGFRLIYVVMRRILASQGEAILKTHWDTVQRYFFVRFCMMSCASGEDGHRKFKERCLVPVISNKDFASHFQCASRPGFKSDSCVNSFFGM